MSRRFQFSLKVVLVAPVIVGVLALAWAGKPTWVAYISVRLSLVAFFAFVAVPIVQGGRLGRAFGIGAILPSAIGAWIEVHPLLVVPQGGMTPDLPAMAIRNLDEFKVPDLRFRAECVFVASAVGGIAGMAISWLTSSNTTENQPMRRPQFTLKTLLWLMV